MFKIYDLLKKVISFCILRKNSFYNKFQNLPFALQMLTLGYMNIWCVCEAILMFFIFMTLFPTAPTSTTATWAQPLT